MDVCENHLFYFTFILFHVRCIEGISLIIAQMLSIGGDGDFIAVFSTEIFTEHKSLKC